MEQNNLSIPTSNERIVSPSELVTIVSAPAERINPIQHRLAREVTIIAMEKHVEQRSHEFHMLSHEDRRYLGLFSGREKREIEWLIGINNFADGFRVMEVHSGIYIPAARGIVCFHATQQVFARYTFRTSDEIQALVNERLDDLRCHFNLEFDRMDRWKSKKLSRSDAHDAICLAIRDGAIAGRSAHEYITSWHNPSCDYFKPRTMWSLFCLTSSFLNRLTAPPIIERTIALHEFFDKLTGFNLKPTKWVQADML